MSAAAEAIKKLESLSEDRARTVIGLIDEFAHLEELERQSDLQAARASLAEPGEDVPWETVKQELDAKFNYPSSASQKVSR